VAHNNGLYLVSGSYGVILGSKDNGLHWNNIMRNSRLFKILHGNDKYVISGEHGYIGTSSDSRTWNYQWSQKAKNFTSIEYGNDVFVAMANSRGASDSGTIIVSADAENWQAGNWDSNLKNYSMTFGNGLFAIASSTNEFDSIYTSTDGITWSGAAHLTTWGRRLFFVNGNFVLSTNKSEIWVSQDAQTWNKFTMPTADPFWSLAYFKGQYLASVSRSMPKPSPNTPEPNYIYTSPDLENWTLVNTDNSALGLIEITQADNYLAGTFNFELRTTVCLSDNGTSWQQIFTPGNYSVANQLLDIVSTDNLLTVTTMDGTILISNPNSLNLERSFHKITSFNDFNLTEQKNSILLEFNVEFMNVPIALQIFNSNGIIIYSKTGVINSPNLKISRLRWPDGVYFLDMEIGSRRLTRQFTIKK